MLTPWLNPYAWLLVVLDSWHTVALRGPSLRSGLLGHHIGNLSLASSQKCAKCGHGEDSCTKRGDYLKEVK